MVHGLIDESFLDLFERRLLRTAPPTRGVSAVDSPLGPTKYPRSGFSSSLHGALEEAALLARDHGFAEAAVTFDPLALRLGPPAGASRIAFTRALGRPYDEQEVFIECTGSHRQSLKSAVEFESEFTIETALRHVAAWLDMCLRSTTT